MGTLDSTSEPSQSPSEPRLPDPLQQIQLLRRMGADVSEIEHLAEQEAIDQLWEETHNKVAAEYRFMGLLAGYPKNGGYNPEHEEVVAAREAVVKAFEQFFALDVRKLADEKMEQAEAEKERLIRDAPYMEDIANDILPEFPASGSMIGSAPFWTNAIHGAGVQYIDGIIAGDTYNLPEGPTRISNGSYTTSWPNQNEALGRARRLAALVQEYRVLDQAAYEQQITNILQAFVSIWEDLKKFYDQVMFEIESGYSLLAANRVAAGIWQEGHLGILAGAISLAITGAAAGLTLVVSRMVFQQAVRQAIRVLPSRPRVQGVVAGVVMNIQISMARPNGIGTPEIGSRYFYEHRVETPTDLRPSERAVYDLGNQGTSRTDKDQGIRTGPKGGRDGWFNEDGSLKKAFRGMDPDLDVAELKRIVGKDNWDLARSREDHSGAVRVREKIIETYENYFSTGDTKALDGMNTELPLHILTYPPPDSVTQWVRVDPDGNKVHDGQYFDPSNGNSTPSELGINSVGRGEERIDLSQNRGVALQGYGASVKDKWTISGPNGVRKTDGGPLQWHVPKQYTSQMDGQMTGTTWRDLPGNSSIVEQEGTGLRWENVNGRDQWVYDGPPMDSLDNGQKR